MTADPMVALVTGANKGIGWEIARALGEQGFVVLAGGRSVERLQQAIKRLEAVGVGAKPLLIDVTEDRAVASAADTVRQRWGRVDVLVNNAGVLLEPVGSGMRPSTTPIEIVTKTYETNLFGAIRVTNAMLPLLLKADEPRIVNVTSWLASLASNGPGTRAAEALNLLAYNTSKTALNAVTLAYAKEFHGTALKINAVDPGHCATDINGNVGDRTPEQAAALPVWAATLPADGPSGEFVSGDAVLPW
ncbi:MAG TPA: SDR family oxidoreductase [Solirubrobacterales bacterium]|nr:SDR family oxidoreductase [Solirubrobacterales bacterium]